MLALAIIFLAGFLRIFNMQWDHGFHMHPDERAIIMKVTSLALPSSFSDFFSPESTLNPKFFAYGSLPFYLLFFVGSLGESIGYHVLQYDPITIIGRYISAFFDIGSLIVLFFLAKKMFGKKIGLITILLYALSALPIQLSHFYAVDTILTFFVLLTLYQLLSFYEKPTILKALLVGIVFGAALATKISSSVLLASIGLAIAVDFLFLVLNNPRHTKHYLPHLPAFIKHLATYLITIILGAIVTFLLFEPYAFLDFQTFISQTLEQSQMTRNAFTFPYTLQYALKTPYFYELKNLFFWGQGPFIATFSLLGILYLTHLGFVKKKEGKWAMEIIILSFFWMYFFIVGKFAVGFMRYILPLYPLFCLAGGVFLYRVYQKTKQHVSKPLLLITSCLLFLLFLIWPLSFLSIYSHPNPKVAATQWILNNIPQGKTLAIEHWDDSLPLYNQEKYTMFILPLYESDTELKWNGIKRQLNTADYVILASNRLSTPLQKLTDCKMLPQGRCYTKTAEYYHNLFTNQPAVSSNGKPLIFTKIAEFTNFPTIPFVNIPIPDQEADESFTVYDHPKVIIFKKRP